IGLPGKNRAIFRGKPSFRYGLDAALATAAIERVFVSTDDDLILQELSGGPAFPLRRPDELAQGDTRMLDVIRFELERIEEMVGEVQTLVILLANSVTVTGRMIDKALCLLAESPEADSIVPVSAFPQWSPHRAVHLGADGLLSPWLDIKGATQVSSNRQELP